MREASRLQPHECFSVLCLLSVVLITGLKDLGAPNWSCDSSVMAKSKKVPTSAHSVRFADIKVIGALGDSLTVGLL